MSTTIVCPSGLSVVVRGMKGRELKVLSNVAALKSGEFIDQIFDACVESVIDPGPYDLTPDGKLNWNDVLVGDRIYVSVRVRVETFGDEFAFNARCGTCGKKEEYAFNLTSLEVKELSTEDRAAFKAGPLKTAFPGTGAEVKFRLATGSDEKWIAKTSNNKDAAVMDMLARRIVSIEGADRPKAFLEEASLGDVMTLLKEMNKRDCGVETSVALTCPDATCEATSEINIPIGSLRPFWIPK